MTWCIARADLSEIRALGISCRGRNATIAGGEAGRLRMRSSPTEITHVGIADTLRFTPDRPAGFFHPVLLQACRNSVDRVRLKCATATIRIRYAVHPQGW